MTTQPHVPEGLNPQEYRRKNLKKISQIRGNPEKEIEEQILQSLS